MPVLAPVMRYCLVMRGHGKPTLTASREAGSPALELGKRYPHLGKSEGWPNPYQDHNPALQGVRLTTLAQAEFWWDKNGRRWRITEMNPGHIMAMPGFLFNSSKTLYYAWQDETLPPTVTDRFSDEAALARFGESDPYLRWLKKTPLYQAFELERAWRLAQKCRCNLCQKESALSWGDIFSYGEEGQVIGDRDRFIRACPDWQAKKERSQIEMTCPDCLEELRLKPGQGIKKPANPGRLLY
jgi:hypothetical protein